MARRIKKVEGGHGHHGGAWKVAYADFVTAMMALFMVMWLLASTDQQTRKEISNYFRSGILVDGDMSMNHAAQITPSVIEAAPAPPPPGEASLDERVETAKQLQERLNRLAAVDTDLAQVVRNVHVEITPDGVLIEAVDQEGGLLFDLSSAKLNEPLERFLRAIGPPIALIGRPIEINGHTDARPFAHGAKLSNWDLSYQRAAASREILVSAGVPEANIAGVFARGASRLYVPDQPLAAQNRRLSILIKIAKPGDKKPADPDASPGDH
ncbi:MAG TPA: flagellar motor protein MotB [Kofleriaceae bacterium]|nr:flagellar motor protein MotB [Kofleriaceae bacterium]